MGVLAVAPNGPEALSPESLRVLDSFARQVGLALEVERLQESTRLAQLESETERLKASLLSAVTHDLQTPLAAISGSAESLLLADESMAFTAHAHARQRISPFFNLSIKSTTSSDISVVATIHNI